VKHPQPTTPPTTTPHWVRKHDIHPVRRVYFRGKRENVWAAKDVHRRRKKWDEEVRIEVTPRERSNWNGERHLETSPQRREMGKSLELWKNIKRMIACR